MLVQELGIDPGPEVVALERAILGQDPVLEVPSAATASRRSPYPGLRAYDVADAEAFFGRERDTAACLDRLRSTGILAVVGPSGTGKSSLVRAGVAAALRREGHHVDVITPGARPLDAWPAEVPAHRRPVLVVDQCEEVFALCDQPAARTEFLDRVVARAGSAGAPGVVVALRADRMGDLAGHPAFGRLVERGLYLLGAMGEDDLRAAIEGPARQAGLLVEPGLVDLLLREVEGAPAILPMLSHSLRETWVRREGRTLTVAGYHASGGIREAIARTAEAVYEQSSPRRRELMRDLMLRLVAPGADGAPLLARVPRSLLAADPEQAGIVDALVAARLVTIDEGSVGLTHEAIVRSWPRLGRWLDEDLEGRRILHHLAGAADAWDGLGRPPS
jgi:energy-coupling factor transporter ATP-binding protein EcfA2